MIIMIIRINIVWILLYIIAYSVCFSIYIYVCLYVYNYNIYMAYIHIDVSYTRENLSPPNYL